MQSGEESIIKTGGLPIEARKDRQSRGDWSQQIGARSHDWQLPSGCAFIGSTP